MVSINHQILKRFFDTYSGNPSLHNLKKKLETKTSTPSTPDGIDDIVNIYHAAISVIENEIWSEGSSEASINMYQRLFQELEGLIALKGKDTRHKFVIVIPVADRPRHLQSCLQSLLILCQSFHYGSYSNQQFPKVSVIIADDTKDQANIRKHKAISCHFNGQGIKTIYFGLDEQREQLERLTKDERKRLLNIVGDFDSSPFYHKGPSVMRNISYLKLNEMSKEEKNLLFHFVDSDQEFQVKIQSDGEDKELYAINYFYELDRLFSQHDISILTGKVIGDPPVSPAVMAGTFIDDMIAFLHRMAATEHHLPCQFHNQSHQKEHDAAYHDMAELFGFKPASEPYHYRCNLTGEHDHSKCFTDVASKLSQFFHGEHPTRKSYFNHEEPVSDIKPARTIYTGNYLFNAEGLKYFIPFARLKLRMAGPVLGRIVKSESKTRFVSANLPMLHKRTVEDIGKSEFRPGIDSEQNKIDLSGEFERQFFGDVMLFTMEKLTAMGYPAKSVPKQMIFQALESTEQDTRQQYAAKQAQILDKLNLMKSIFFSSNNWWNTTSGMESARENFTIFINNIEQNFGEDSRCYEIIDSDVNRSKRFDEMLEAIIEYPADRQAWTTTLETQRDRQRFGFRDKSNEQSQATTDL
jgi:hypothetical protein